MANKKRIAALMVCAANEVGNKEETTKKYWKIRSKTLKNEIKEKKRKQPKIASNEELAALMLNANTVNIAIHAVQQICRTDDGENLLHTTT